MKTVIEINEEMDRLKNFLDNSQDIYYAFSPSSYEDITNKINQSRGKFQILESLIDKTDNELISMLKEKNDLYDIINGTGSGNIYELQGEILAIRWALK
jgi:hypothetical protein